MYQGEVDVAEDDLRSFLQVAKDLNVKGLCETNPDHFESIEVDPSQYPYQNNYPTIKWKGTTEKEEMRNKNDFIDVGRISNETEKIFTLETNPKNVTSNVNENKIKYEVSTEAYNDVDAKTFLVTNEIAENTRQNRISTVAVQEGRRSYPCGQCNYKATHKPHFKQHIKSIHEGERYPCDQCSYKATTKSSFRRHQFKLKKH